VKDDNAFSDFVAYQADELLFGTASAVCTT